MISVSYDEPSGIVCTVANGLASVEDFNAYAPRCVDFLARSRARHGRSLHLVDAQDNPIQTRDAFDHMADASRGLIGEDDRCAVVLHSALARMQIDRMPDSFTRKFFNDRASAQAWLLLQVATVGAGVGAGA
ncbi:STAS/SEC14 domain-containing protein [Sphingobium sufflavum]|uniref:STAS/SEC14 domain-containing protein n=1 Tax=Sphingobium sufflavum TaxID=1129547 RepID=UPI001F36ACD1|nr:STAS/SEC14 domain-containing protein [Sphingobium sufflavum]MCE7797666.1 STAS/SEC14 domain-containing protein [Sphingobium sufflavum]